MKKEEELLRALGNVKDSYILEPSRYLGNPQRFMPQGKEKKWPAFAAIAAAAALVMIGGIYSVRFMQSTPQLADASIASNGGTETIATQASPQTQWMHPEGWPSFRMEYDEEALDMDMGVDGLLLRPKQYSPELPICQLKIEFLPNLLPYAAAEKSRAELADDLTPVHQDQETLRYSFRVSTDSAWNSTVKVVTIVGAGSRGSFRLTNQYFVEAAEGWGSTFAGICAGFTCPLEESANPEAERVILEFAEGYFSGNQLTMLSNYYGDSGDLRDTYSQDASRVRIVSLQGLEELDNWIEKDGFAHVSLAFLETEQSDSYTYLSMEVMKTQAGYRVSFYGLEK